MSYQKIIIVGNVGKDAEMRYTPAGQAVTSFSVAVNHAYTAKSGEKVKETTWFRVEAWGKSAEICAEYVKKGATLLVEGRLKSEQETGGPRVWTDKQGNPRASFELQADQVRFLSKTEQREQSQDFAGDF
jgi:single-strand DNA-binding protein